MTHFALVARAVNAEGVSERKPSEEVRAALTRGGDFGLPNVVAVCEASWLDVHRLAASLGWYALQEGERGSPEAGVALLADKPLLQLGSIVGSRANSQVRQRTMLGGRVYGLSWWSIHAPPKYAGDVHYDYIVRARSRRGVVMGDWNERDEWMRQTSQRHYRALEHDVMGMLIPSRLRASEARRVDVDSDHWGIDVRIEIPHRR